ncbi:peptidase [Actibacterium pelagium]|uniref:Uncharacterized protein n=1 Tax=Actibacterium pelagium TaxID=2029103 RepID=A0A917EGW8_9RHOB|nr:peptidase [Actibacterium pelagium]GGE38144.1 hypothetical protein GCM10011517_02390 [Actibacterium pelagium]
MKLEALAVYEQPLKWFALGLGVCSTVCVVQGWQLAAMLFSLPFCLIWMYSGWLRTEPQLKYINMLFSVLYVYGIGRYFWLQA